MVWIVGEWRVLLCLVLITMAFSVIAGCQASDIGFVLTPEVCEKMSGLDRDHCYQNVARAKGDPELCREINNPGPRSKCFVYLGKCEELGRQATGDGAYTFYDCAQYRAIEYGSVQMCENDLSHFRSENRNDLNPTGISEGTCKERVLKNCGSYGMNVCYDKFYNMEYCEYGVKENGKCVWPSSVAS
ncbi:MAG: hypothetical protein LUQ54_01775 [Methanoregula sp.]|nr:hypothetical protein [Methanoregula sp.]